MIFILLGIAIPLFIGFRIYTNKFYNPYTLTLIYGKKGCGKSTVAQKYIYQHYKKGWHIYYNQGDSRFKMGTAIDASKLWEVQFEPHSLLIIDEVNLLWDNRQFKTFPKELGEWFRLQRHYKVKVILFSQTADADKKIRDLTDTVYLCKRYFQVLICCTPYVKEIIYREPQFAGDVSGFIDHYRKLSWGPLGCNFCWLPKWVKFHDSFADLTDRETANASKGDKNNDNNPNVFSSHGDNSNRIRVSDIFHNRKNRYKSEKFKRKQKKMKIDRKKY